MERAARGADLFAQPFQPPGPYPIEDRCK